MAQSTQTNAIGIFNGIGGSGPDQTPPDPGYLYIIYWTIGDGTERVIVKVGMTRANDLRAYLFRRYVPPDFTVYRTLFFTDCIGEAENAMIKDMGIHHPKYMGKEWFIVPNRLVRGSEDSGLWLQLLAITWPTSIKDFLPYMPRDINSWNRHRGCIQRPQLDPKIQWGELKTHNRGAAWFRTL